MCACKKLIGSRIVFLSKKDRVEHLTKDVLRFQRDLEGANEQISSGPSKIDLGPSFRYVCVGFILFNPFFAAFCPGKIDAESERLRGQIEDEKGRCEEAQTALRQVTH